MKNLTLVVIVLLTVWLQANFFGGLRPFGVVPDPLIIVIIYAGLTRDPIEAVAMAVGGGLLLDVASGADFGLRTAFYAALALLVMVAKQSGVDFDNVGLVLLMTVGATAVFNLAVLVTPLLRHELISWAVVGREVATVLLLNLALAFILKPILIKLLKRGSNVPLVLR